MRNNTQKTLVRDIIYLVNTNFLKSQTDTSIEKLAKLLCTSDKYKIYLEDMDGCLAGTIQAKKIALQMLQFMTNEKKVQELLPAVAFLMNSQSAIEIIEPPVTVTLDSTLQEVIEIMDKKYVREVAVIDQKKNLIGVLEAKRILGFYIHAKAETSF